MGCLALAPESFGSISSHALEVVKVKLTDQSLDTLVSPFAKKRPMSTPSGSYGDGVGEKRPSIVPTTVMARNSWFA